jgi:gamma-glutamyltranspeptidase/glutathione hydrolase
VPGAIGGWALALDLARALGGRLPLPDLLRDAIRFGRDGYPQSRSEANGKPFEFDMLKEAPGFAERFLVDGKFPEAGTLRRAGKLADTLDQLAHEGLDDFYRGDVARELAADIEQMARRSRAKIFPPTAPLRAIRSNCICRDALTIIRRRRRKAWRRC